MNAASRLDRKPVNLQSNPAPALVKRRSARLTEARQEGSEGLRKRCSELSPVISITARGDGSARVCVCAFQQSYPSQASVSRPGQENSESH